MNSQTCTGQILAGPDEGLAYIAQSEESHSIHRPTFLTREQRTHAPPTTHTTSTAETLHSQPWICATPPTPRSRLLASSGFPSRRHRRRASIPPRARARAMGVPPLHAPPRRFLPRAWLGNFVEHLNRV